jgi:serine/threonine-protein kinase
MLPAHHYDLTVMLHTEIVLAGRFRLERRIGSGGVGEVWRAVDLRMGAPVAVKVLTSESPWPPATLTRFRAAARQTSSVSHPGIARVHHYDDGDPPIPPYLVTELVMGPSLARVLACGRLEPARTMDVISLAAAALGAAHEAGLVHGGIKPANLLIALGGEVKITDFGITAAASAGRAHTGAMAGPPDYLAPECAAGLPATWASDLYSLGVVGYECLAGLPPFHGSPLEVSAAHRCYPLPPLPESVPGTIAAFVAKLTAKDPHDRPTSADQASWWAMQLRDSLARGPGVLPRSWQAGSAAVAARGLAPGPGSTAGRRGGPRGGSYPREPDPGPAALARLEPATVAGAGPVMPVGLTRVDGDRPVPYPRNGHSRPPYPRTDRRVEPYRRQARSRNRLALLLACAAAAVAALIVMLAFGVFRGSPPARPAAATSARASAHARVAPTVLVTAAALIGRPATAVRAELRKLGLKPHLVRSVTTAQAAGLVVSVQPGGQLPAGSMVTVTEAVAPAPPPPAPSATPAPTPAPTRGGSGGGGGGGSDGGGGGE